MGKVWTGEEDGSFYMYFLFIFHVDLLVHFNYITNFN